MPGMAIIKTYYAGVVDYVSGTVVWSLDWAENTPGTVPVLDTYGLPQDRIGVTVVEPPTGATGVATLTATVDGIAVQEGITLTVAPVGVAPTPGFNVIGPTIPRVYFGNTATPAQYQQGNALTQKNEFLAKVSGLQTENFSSFNLARLPPMSIFGGAGNITDRHIALGLGYPNSAHVQNITTYGRFNTTGAESAPVAGKWLETGLSFNISFTNPISAFGTYITDSGDFDGLMTVIAEGPTSYRMFPLVFPKTGTGGLSFFGFTDVATYTNLIIHIIQLNPAVSSTWDFSGFDDMMIGYAVPEPVLFGPAPFTVGIEDTSIGATTWGYDFTNDGIIDSTSSTPNITYSEPGIYSIRQVVQNTNGSATLTRNNVVEVTQVPNWLTVYQGHTEVPVNQQTTITITKRDEFLSRLSTYTQESFSSIIDGSRSSQSVLGGAGIITSSGSFSIESSSGGGLFNTTGAESAPVAGKWLKTNVNCTLTLTTPTRAFGMYVTNLGELSGYLAIKMTGPGNLTIGLPVLIPLNSISGTITFFGVVHPSLTYDVIEIAMISNTGNYYIGIDDIIIGTVSA